MNTIVNTSSSKQGKDLSEIKYSMCIYKKSKFCHQYIINKCQSAMFHIASFAILIILVFCTLTNAQYLAPNLESADLESPVEAYDLAANTTLKNLLESPSTGRSIDANGDLVDGSGAKVDDYFTDLQRYLTNPTGYTGVQDPEKFNLALAMAVDWTRDVDGNSTADLVDRIQQVYDSLSLGMPTYLECLSPTLETQFSKDLAKLVFQLDYNPVKIYQWVYENIEFENYELSRKGALATYRTKRGNEWDQCSLLITLFRMSGIPARYVYANGKQYQSLPTLIDDVSTADVVETDLSKKDVVLVQAWLSNLPVGVERSIESLTASWVTLVPWSKTSRLSSSGIDLFPEPGASSTYAVPNSFKSIAEDYLSPVTAKSYTHGLNYDYRQYHPYDQAYNWSTIKDIELHAVLKKGYADKINISYGINVDQTAYYGLLGYTGVLAYEKQDECFGLTFTGYIKIAEPGNYKFYIGSDNAAILWVDDQIVIDDNSFHGYTEKSSQALLLSEGMHAIKLLYIQYKGGADLSVMYEGPNIAKKNIPDNLWYIDSYDAHTQQTAVEFLEHELQDYIISQPGYAGKSIKDVPSVKSIVFQITGVLPSSLPSVINADVTEVLDVNGLPVKDFVADDLSDLEMVGKAVGDLPDPDQFRAGVEFNLVGAPLFYPNVLEGWWRANGTTAGSAPIDDAIKWNGTSSLTEYKLLVQGWESNAFIFSYDVNGVDELENENFFIKIAEPGVSSGFGHDSFTQRTISMFIWVPPGGTSGEHYLYEEGGSDAGLYIKISNGNIYGGFNIEGSYFQAQDIFDESMTSSWKHVAFVFKNSVFLDVIDGVVQEPENNISIYVDGKKTIGGVNTYLVVPSHTDGGAIGAKYWKDSSGNVLSGSYFSGYMDHVQVYNVALTTDQILAIAGKNQISRIRDTEDPENIKDKRLLLPQLADRRLTVDFNQLQYDQNGDGVAEDILRPVMQLDGKTFDEGEGSLSSYSLLSDYYRIEYRYETDTNWKRRPFIGAYFDSVVESESRLPFVNISFDGLEASANGMQQQIAELGMLSPEDASSDDMQIREGYLGRVSELLAQTFQYRLIKNISRVDELLNVERLHSDSTHNMTAIWTFRNHSTGLTYVQKVDKNGGLVTDANGDPVMVASTHEASAMGIHAGWRIDSIFTLGKIHKTVNPQYLYDLDHPLGHFAASIAGHTASYNEGRIFEDWQGTPALSTVSGIFMAIEDPANAVVTFTPDNLIDIAGIKTQEQLENEIRDQLALSKDAEDKIIGDLKSGGTVTTPTSTVSIIDPSTGLPVVTSDVKLVDRSTSIQWAFSDFGGGQSDQDTDTANYIDAVSVIAFDINRNAQTLANATMQGADGSYIGEALRTEQVARTVFAGGDPVDLVTGEFYLDEPADLMIRSRGLSLGIVRKYRSQAIYDGPFGYGWTWNHAESLLFKEGSSDVIFYTSERRPFECVENGDGTFTVPPGSTFELLQLVGGPNVGGYEVRTKDGSAIVFASDGRLIEKRDVHGNKLTFSYDGTNSNLIKITDAIGRSIFLTYAGGKVVSATDYTGRSVQYAYNSNDLTSFTDAKNSIFQYEYLSSQSNALNNHNMDKQILPNGDYLEIYYYKNDTVSHHTSQIGNTFHFQYSWLNRYSETWSEKGYYRKVFYNTSWDVIRIETEDKAVEFREYDIDHNMISRVDGNGQTTTYRYDVQRNLISTTNPIGEIWVYEYESTFNRRTAEINPQGVVNLYQYTAQGMLEKSQVAVYRVAVETDVDGIPTHTSGGTPIETFDFPQSGESRFEYDAFGNVVKEIQVLRPVSVDEPEVATIKQYTYDINHVNVVLVIDPEGNTSKFVYDDLSRVVAATDPAGNTQQFTYNAIGQQLTSTDAAGGVTQKIYDANGRLTQTINPRGAVSQAVYGSPFYVDHYSRVLQEIDSLGNIVNHQYDEVGNRIQSTDRNGNITRVKYDELGRVIETIDALGNTTRHRYDGNGNRIESVDARGNIMAYEFDAANRPILTRHVNPTENIDSTVHPANQRAVKNVYDINGNVEQTIDGYVDNNGLFVELFKTKHIYDARNQRIQTIQNFDDQVIPIEAERITDFTYDALGRLIAQVEVDLRKTEYTYDLNGKTLTEVTSLNVNGVWEPQRTLQSEYDNRQLVSKSFDANGVARTYTYDVLGRRITEAVDVTDAMTSVVKTDINKTTYDAVGNVVRTETFVDNTRISFSDVTYNLRNEQLTATNALGHTSSFEYDPNGNRVAITDADRNTSHVYYDALNRTIATENALGHTSSVQYDASGNQLATVNALGQRTAFVYNRYNQLIQATDPLGNVAKTSYDEQGRQITVTDARGHTTSTVYTSFSEVAAVSTNVTLVDGITQQTLTSTNTYDNLGRLLTATDPRGTVTRQEYDILGRVVKLIQADGDSYQVTTAYIYDANGNRTSETRAVGTPLQTTTDFQYDELNRVIKSTSGVELALTAPDKQLTTTTHYDDEARTVTVTDPYGVTSTRHSDILGRNVMVADAEGNFTISHYDRRNNVIKTASYNADQISNFTFNATTGSYTDNGSATFIDAPVVNQYDALNRLIARTQDSATVTTDYDQLGRVIRTTDEKNIATTHMFDIAGRRIRTTQAVGTLEQAVTKFEYDANSNLVTIIDAKHADISAPHVTNAERGSPDQPSLAVARYEYDELNRRIKETDADGTSQKVQYDESGNVVAITRRDGTIVYNAFDTLNRRTSVTYNGLVQQTFEYDALSRMIKSVDNNQGRQTHAIEYSYDFANRAIEESAYDSDLRPADTQPAHVLRSVITAYTLTPLNNLTSQTIHKTYPAGPGTSGGREIQITKDARGLLRDMDDLTASKPLATYRYDALGRVNQLDLHQPDIQGTLSFDIRGREDVRKYVLNPLTTNTTLYESNLDLDAVGNIISDTIVTAPALALDIDRNYTHDNQHRLTGEDNDSTTTGNEVDWQYDLVGNWVHTNQNGYEETRQINDDNEYSFNFDGTASNAITDDPPGTLGAPAFTTTAYDGRGNLLTYGSKQFTYDWANRLIEVTESASTLVTYTYDAANRRVTKSIPAPGGDTTLYAYDGGQVVQEFVTPNSSSTTTLARSFVYGLYIDEPLALIDETTVTPTYYYYVRDRRASLIGLLNDGGSFVELYTYTAFGKMTVLRPGVDGQWDTADDIIAPDAKSIYGNPYGFTGRRWDAEIGLWYYRNRMYSAELGRFLQRDPLGYIDGYNMYAYVGNRPFFATDPSGLVSYTYYADGTNNDELKREYVPSEGTFPPAITNVYRMYQADTGNKHYFRGIGNEQDATSRAMQFWQQLTGHGTSKIGNDIYNQIVKDYNAHRDEPFYINFVLFSRGIGGIDWAQTRIRNEGIPDLSSAVPVFASVGWGPQAIKYQTGVYYTEYLQKPKMDLVIAFDPVYSMGFARGLFQSIDIGYSKDFSSFKNFVGIYSINEDRAVFTPEMFYGQDNVTRFAAYGVHSDSGGGYPLSQRGLADASLATAMNIGEFFGMEFNESAMDDPLKPNVGGKHHDENEGLLNWAIWGDNVRKKIIMLANHGNIPTIVGPGIIRRGQPVSNGRPLNIMDVKDYLYEKLFPEKDRSFKLDTSPEIIRDMYKEPDPSGIKWEIDWKAEGVNTGFSDNIDGARSAAFVKSPRSGF